MLAIRFDDNTKSHEYKCRSNIYDKLHIVEIKPSNFSLSNANSIQVQCVYFESIPFDETNTLAYKI